MVLECLWRYGGVSYINSIRVSPWHFGGVSTIAQHLGMSRGFSSDMLVAGEPTPKLISAGLLLVALFGQESNCLFTFRAGWRTVPKKPEQETDDEADQDAPDDQGDPCLFWHRHLAHFSRR